MATNNNNRETTIKKTFPVLGMTCASCASSAESITRHEPGVVTASVNFATGNLSVEYLPNMTIAKGNAVGWL
jgi:Cu2+-exporting ATPase